MNTELDNLPSVYNNTDSQAKNNLPSNIPAELTSIISNELARNGRICLSEKNEINKDYYNPIPKPIFRIIQCAFSKASQDTIFNNHDPLCDYSVMFSFDQLVKETGENKRNMYHIIEEEYLPRLDSCRYVSINKSCFESFPLFTKVTYDGTTKVLTLKLNGDLLLHFSTNLCKDPLGYSKNSNINSNFININKMEKGFSVIPNLMSQRRDQRIVALYTFLKSHLFKSNSVNIELEELKLANLIFAPKYCYKKIDNKYYYDCVIRKYLNRLVNDLVNEINNDDLSEFNVSVITNIRSIYIFTITALQKDLSSLKEVKDYLREEYPSSLSIENYDNVEGWSQKYIDTFKGFSSLPFKLRYPYTTEQFCLDTYKYCLCSFDYFINSKFNKKELLLQWFYDNFNEANNTKYIRRKYSFCVDNLLKEIDYFMVKTDLISKEDYEIKKQVFIQQVKEKYGHLPYEDYLNYISDLFNVLSNYLFTYKDYDKLEEKEKKEMCYCNYSMFDYYRSAVNPYQKWLFHDREQDSIEN